MFMVHYFIVNSMYDEDNDLVMLGTEIAVTSLQQMKIFCLQEIQ